MKEACVFFRAAAAPVISGAPETKSTDVFIPQLENGHRTFIMTLKFTLNKKNDVIIVGKNVFNLKAVSHPELFLRNEEW